MSRARPTSKRPLRRSSLSSASSSKRPEAKAGAQVTPRQLMLGILALLVLLYGAFNWSLWRGTRSAWQELRPKTEFDHAKLMAARPWGLPAAAGTSPGEAGEILHRLYFGGLSPAFFAETGVKPTTPDRTTVPPLDPAAVDLSQLERVPEADSLFQGMGIAVETWDSLSTQARRFSLDEKGEDLFARLATAPGIEVLDARYQLPFDDTLRAEQLEHARVGRVRDIALDRVGRAAVALGRGQPAEAERMGRELVSVGELLYRDSPFLVESLLGAVLVGHGMRVLDFTYQAAGDTARLHRLRAALATPAGPLPAPRFGGLPEYVGREDIPASLKWEHLHVEALMQTCKSLPLFPLGPHPYREVEPVLARTPGERALFELYTRDAPPVRSLLDWPLMFSRCFGGEEASLER